MVFVPFPLSKIHSPLTTCLQLPDLIKYFFKYHFFQRRLRLFVAKSCLHSPSCPSAPQYSWPWPYFCLWCGPCPLNPQHLRSASPTSAVSEASSFDAAPQAESSCSVCSVLTPCTPAPCVVLIIQFLWGCCSVLCFEYQTLTYRMMRCSWRYETISHASCRQANSVLLGE